MSGVHFPALDASYFLLLHVPAPSLYEPGLGFLTYCEPFQNVEGIFKMSKGSSFFLKGIGIIRCRKRQPVVN